MPSERKPRTYTLRRASSIVFAMISVLPLLLFAYTLYALNMLQQQIAQIGLGSALVLVLIGFYMYSVMIARLSEILRELETDESGPPQPEVHQGPVVTMAVEPSPGVPMAKGHAGGSSGPAPMPRPDQPGPFASRGRPGGRSGVGARAGLVIPGVGRITELKPADGAALSDLDLMWRTEAEPLLGKRVLVAVRNTADPIKGVLSQVTKDGVILDQSGAKLGISYTRVSAIEADTAPGPA
jgi:hypothetical protein